MKYLALEKGFLEDFDEAVIAALEKAHQLQREEFEDELDNIPNV